MVVRSASSRRRGRLKILTAKVADDTGEIKATWFNQPWLAEKLSAGTRIRLRGRANRHGFAVSSYDLEGDGATADFAPVYPASEELRRSSGSPRPGARARARRGKPLPGALLVREALPLRADALGAVPGRARWPKPRSGGSDSHSTTPRPSARARADGRRAGTGVRSALGAPGELLARYRVSPSRSLRSGALDRRDRPRSRALDPDAAAAAGGRRLGEDGGRAPRFCAPSSSSARGADGRRRPWPSSIS